MAGNDPFLPNGGRMPSPSGDDRPLADGGVAGGDTGYAFGNSLPGGTSALAKGYTKRTPLAGCGSDGMDPA